MTTLRLLVADNDVTWLDLLALDLRLEGFDVVATAIDADSVLEHLAASADEVDVLVTDHRMPPGRTGLELLEIVHRDHPQIRLVLFTNYAMDAVARDRIVAAGAHYVAKPDLRKLRAAISSPAPSSPPRAG